MKSTANINPKQMDYNLDFIIRKTATAAPRFILVPTGKQQTFTGGLRLNGTRTDTHSLKISLVPPADRVEIACARDIDRRQMPDAGLHRSGAERGAGSKSRARDAWHVHTEAAASVPWKRTTSIAPRAANLLQGIDDQLRRQGIGQ